MLGPQVRADLERFVALLSEWQGTHNLVSRASLHSVWTRHVADSLQLLDHAPDFGDWVDLGSGAGFPGLVVAIASKPFADRRFTLVEANAKKAAFLRAAIRATGARAEVAPVRIEDHARAFGRSADIVSARALAPLPALLPLAAPYLRDGNGSLLLLKGQNLAEEAEEASKSWIYDMVTMPSVTDPGGRVVTIRNLRPRARA